MKRALTDELLKDFFKAAFIKTAVSDKDYVNNVEKLSLETLLKMMGQDTNKKFNIIDEIIYKDDFPTNGMFFIKLQHESAKYSYHSIFLNGYKNWISYNIPEEKFNNLEYV